MIKEEEDPLASSELLSFLGKKENLTHSQHSDWISVTKKDFDCVVENEPHSAVSFHLNPKTKMYLSRIWGKTWKRGVFSDLPDLEAILAQDFYKVQPCLGIPDGRGTHGAVRLKWPFPRLASGQCQLFTKDGTKMCQPCSAVCKIPESACLKCDSQFGNLLKAVEELRMHISLLHGDGPLREEEKINSETVFETLDSEALLEKSDELVEMLGNNDANFVESDFGSDACQTFEESTKYKEDIMAEISDDSDDEPLYKKRRPGRRKKKKSQASQCLKRIKIVRPNSESKKEATDCPKCVMHYVSRYQLEKHLKNNHFKDKYPCPECSEVLEFPDDLESHVIDQHSDNCNCKCPFCQNSIEVLLFCSHLSQCKKTNLAHLSKDGDVMCEVCSKLFKSHSEMSLHANRDHLSYPCPECSDFETESPLDFEDHILDFHESLRSHLQCNFCLVQVPIAKERAWFTDHVQFCKKRANPAPLQQKHAAAEPVVEFGTKCKLCEAEFLFSTSLKYHMETYHFCGVLNCLHCDEKFALTTELQNHMRLNHVNIKDITCKICCRNTEASSMLEHLQKCYEEKYRGNKFAKTTIFCDLCPKSFLRNNELLSHVKSDHLGLAKPDKLPVDEDLADMEEYTCPEEGCHYSSRVLTYFRQHTRRHELKKAGLLKTRVTPKEPCKLCGKVIGRQAMVNHLKFVHKQGSDEAVCEDCGKVYDRFSALQQHIRKVHQAVDAYTCDICQRAFGTSADKRKHYARKHKSPEHTCPTCGKVFALEEALKTHERLHTGERPYNCDVCDASYVSRVSLCRHKAKKHS